MAEGFTRRAILRTNFFSAFNRMRAKESQNVFFTIFRPPLKSFIDE